MSKSSQSILIVDDDINTRTLVTDTIREEGFCCLTEVENGIEALECLRKEHFDLVISDIQMPGMSGIELLHRVKELDPSTSVIIMTGFPTIDLSIAAMKYGAVDFLAKPFKLDDLIFKIKLYLKEKTILTEREWDLKTNTSRLAEKVRELSTISYIYENIEKVDGNNDDIFQEIVNLALRVAGGKSCSLILFDETNNAFHPKVVQSNGNGTGSAATAKVFKSLTPIFREVIHTREALIKNHFKGTDGYNSILCVPLSIRNKIFGLLSLIDDRSENGFTNKDLNYICSLTARASLNVENRLLYESIFTSVIDTFKSLVSSIHERDSYTQRHSHNVTQLALHTAEIMKLSSHEIECLEIASSLHDIGKIAIPDSVLLKPGRLTDEEYSIIKRHPVIGENILKSIKLFETERKIVRHHHERWDGRGYPDGLAGEEIPLLSRILAVADSYDAMTTDRPYRKGMQVEEAVTELLRNRALQFDKDIVDAFIISLR